MCYKMQCRVDVQCNFACIGKSKKRKSCAALLYKKYILLSFQNHILCSDLLLYVNQVDWFNYVSLLQWKVSNHEISLLCITSLGFYWVHRHWSHQTNAWSRGKTTNQMDFRSHECITSSFPQSTIARLILNLLKSRDTIAMFQWSTAFDAFPLWQSRIFWTYKNSKCLTWQI